MAAIELPKWINDNLICNRELINKNVIFHISKNAIYYMII